jgi:NADH-quinone oxidoreductase subunit H
MIPENLLPSVITIIVGAGLIIAFLTVNALFLVWLERKLSARIQLRLGPMQAGFQGIFQTIADAVKLLGKTQVPPSQSDFWVYWFAPLVIFAPLIPLFITIPIGAGLVVKNLELGLLFILAFSSMTAIAIFMAGWSSNNKYGVLGGMRAVAQHIAYKIPLLLAILAVGLQAGTLSMTGVVEAQKSVWFIVTQPICFLLFFISAIAETNRSPFDIPEADSELVAGFMTEYSGMQFALFFLAEYTNMFIVSAVAVTAFLGGWQGPVFPGPVWFFIKSYALISLMIWARFTFPRLRSDQLMQFCWKILIPVALVNVIAVGVLVKFLK